MIGFGRCILQVGLAGFTDGLTGYRVGEDGDKGE